MTRTLVAPHIFFPRREAGEWPRSSVAQPLLPQPGEGGGPPTGDFTSLKTSSGRPATGGASLDSVRSIVNSLAALHLYDYTSPPQRGAPSHKVSAPTWCPETAFREPAPSHVSAPESIYAVFSSDLNILKIHEAICARFSLLFYAVPQMYEEVANLERSALEPSERIAVVERQALIERARTLRERAQKLDSRELWRDYCGLARPHLETYAPVASDEARGAVTIGSAADWTSTVPAPQRAALRLHAIREYLAIARSYINLNAFQTSTDVARCQVCGVPADRGANSDDHGTIVCECGCETVGVTRAATFRDSARIDAGVKNAYEDLGNFIKRIDAFEGKQKTPLPAPLYRQLESYFAAHPLPSGLTPTEIRALPPTPSGKKEGTSIALLGEALLATNNSAFYRDVELIAYKLWGWELADLTTSGLRRALVADYVATQKVYEEYKERGSSLNVNLRLFYHLRVRGYVCALTDFKIVSSMDSLRYHERMLRIMSEKCALPIIALLPALRPPPT